MKNSKEERELYMKKYRKENKELLNKKLREIYNSKKDGLYRVYLLEDYDYVGYTNCIERRFLNHKTKHNRNCNNHRILYTTPNKELAKELEKLLHSMGYKGNGTGKHMKTNPRLGKDNPMWGKKANNQYTKSNYIKNEK